MPRCIGALKGIKIVVVAGMLPPQAESIPDVRMAATPGIRQRPSESRLPKHRKTPIFGALPHGRRGDYSRG